MKRDWELIRKILLEVEAKKTLSGELNSETLSEKWGLDENLVAHNMALTWESGLVASGLFQKIKPDGGFDKQLYIIFGARLTHDGHEFLDPAKNDGIWQKMKEKVGDKLSTLPLELIKPILVGLAKKEIVEAMLMSGVQIPPGA